MGEGSRENGRRKSGAHEQRQLFLEYLLRGERKRNGAVAEVK